MALNSSQYDSIMREYEQIRDYNRTLEAARKQEVYHKLPRVEELDLLVGSASAAAARETLRGNDNALTELRKKLSAIKAEKQALLKGSGFPADYMEPVYDCPDCRDTGYLSLEDGTRQKCNCFRIREDRILYNQSGIQQLMAKENFETLSFDYYQGEDLQFFQAAAKHSRQFVKTFKEDYHNILFYGTVGTGKSFLSGCIANELLKMNCSVLYFSASAFFEQLSRYTFGRDEKTALQSLYDSIYSCDLLIIDDLGTEVTNSFVSSSLFSCLNERHLGRKSTIISTNLSLSDLRDRYSDRVFSRITSNYDLCKLTGPDIRILKKRLAKKEV